MTFSTEETNNMKSQLDELRTLIASTSEIVTQLSGKVETIRINMLLTPYGEEVADSLIQGYAQAVEELDNRRAYLERIKEARTAIARRLNLTNTQFS